MDKIAWKISTVKFFARQCCYEVLRNGAIRR